MADRDASSGSQVLDLQWGESGTALGLKVTFNGGVPVNYGGGKPPAGSVVLVLEHDGQEETVVWMESDWSEPHQLFGYTYRVLNPPELKPRAVRVEIRKD
jgi:hypothetical protein